VQGSCSTAFGSPQAARALGVCESQIAPVLSTPNHADLVVLKELVESGKLKPVIARTYPLRGAALYHIETGHAAGKVDITVGNA
jgi:NADPH:quinone reductase-like Zn-dependent oxidoreductase